MQPVVRAPIYMAIRSLGLQLAVFWLTWFQYLSGDYCKCTIGCRLTHCGNYSWNCSFQVPDDDRRTLEHHWLASNVAWSRLKYKLSNYDGDDATFTLGRSQIDKTSLSSICRPREMHPSRVLIVIAARSVKPPLGPRSHATHFSRKGSEPSRWLFGGHPQHFLFRNPQG